MAVGLFQRTLTIGGRITRNQNLILFIRGKAISGEPIIKGTSQLPNPPGCGQSYKQFTIVIYDSRVVIWGNFKSGTTLES